MHLADEEAAEAPAVGAKPAGRFSALAAIVGSEAIRPWLALVVFAVIVVLMPTFLPSQRLLHLAVIWGIYSIAAYGLSIVYGDTGKTSLAHGALVGVGAYTAAILTLDHGFSFWLALPFCGLMAAVMATAIGYPSLRVSVFYFAIATYALGQFLVLIANNLDYLGRATGLNVTKTVGPIGPLSFNSVESMFYLTAFFLILSMTAVLVLRGSSLGRQFTAVRLNEELAESLGIHANLMKVTAFALSGVFAGVAGAIYVYYQHFMQPRLFDSSYSLLLIVMVVAGGARSLWGPAVGAALWVFLPEVLKIDPVTLQIVFGALLIVCIMALPQGIVGTAELALSQVISTEGRRQTRNAIRRYTKRRLDWFSNLRTARRDRDLPGR